jgi:hypothetical protein
MRVLASTGHDGSCRNYRNRNGDSFAGTCLLGTDRLRPGARKWTPGIQKMHPSPAVASGAIDVSENSLEQPAPERDNRAPSLPIPPPSSPPCHRCRRFVRSSRWSGARPRGNDTRPQVIYATPPITFSRRDGFSSGRATYRTRVWKMRERFQSCPLTRAYN